MAKDLNILMNGKAPATSEPSQAIPETQDDDFLPNTQAAQSAQKYMDAMSEQVGFGSVYLWMSS